MTKCPNSSLDTMGVGLPSHCNESVVRKFLPWNILKWFEVLESRPPVLLISPKCLTTANWRAHQLWLNNEGRGFYRPCYKEDHLFRSQAKVRETPTLIKLSLLLVGQGLKHCLEARYFWHKGHLLSLLLM